jgi:outer membrane protein assembly factor BamB
MKVKHLAVMCVVTACGICAAAAGTGEEILKESGVTGGLVVHIGCGDGSLTAEFCPNERYLVHGLEADAAKVEQARRHIRSRGLYGRVSCESFSGLRLPYADNLVNLLVSDAGCRVPAEEIERVLAPRGVFVDLSDLTDLPDRLTRKPVPSATDEWTHFRHSAGGNMVSQDRRVGPPKHTQWVSGPIFQRHHGIEPSITATVTSGGRIFYIIDEVPTGVTGVPGRWRLVARDAFNGILLWKREMSHWGSHAWSYWTESHAARFNHPLHVRKRLIAKDNRVYVTLGFDSPVTALDAVTGETVSTYEGTDYADEMVLHDGILYVAVNDKRQRPWPGKGVRPEPVGKLPAPSKKQVWAIEAATGKVLWKSGPFIGSAAKVDRMASMCHLNLTVGKQGVFLIDEKHVIGLDGSTGSERWRVERLALPKASEKPLDVGYLYHKLANENVNTVVCHGGRLFVLHMGNIPQLKHSAPATLQALDAATGKELWRYDKATPIAYIEWPDVFGIGDTVWLPDKKGMTLVGLDAATGNEKVVHSVKKALNVGHHHRCYPNRASVKFAVLGRRGAEFVDFKTGELSLNHWLRTGCRSGHVLGNGLLYRPPDHCQCYMAFQPRGFLAMAAEEAKSRTVEESKSKLHKGPAYGSPIRQFSSAEATEDKFAIGNPQSSWPTYRHDPMRSGMASSPLPSSPKQLWQIELGGTLTAPTVAGSKVFVASEDRHEVMAVDANTGRRVWSFTAGGRVDSPPTLSQGYALFGCRDGRVYCLRAGDGELVWRFDAASEESRIVAFGQLESRWPVRGSVLVAGQTAYFMAGRTSMLDGGVYAFALDVATGEVQGSQHIAEVQTETRTTGKLPDGALCDILTTDGLGVYLRNRRLDLPAVAKEVLPRKLAETKPRLTADGGFANKRWFHRAFWNLRSSIGSAKGNLIAFDEKRAYVAAASLPGGPNQTFYMPAGASTNRLAGLDGDGPSWLANPNLHIGGTVLSATKSRADKAKSGAPAPRKGPLGKARKRVSTALWRHNRFPIYPWAMVTDGRQLAVAGPPARVKPDDAWGGFEGRAGGELHVLDAESGKTLSRIKMDSPPAWDGMAAAGGVLYISTQDGRLLCYGTQ